MVSSLSICSTHLGWAFWKYRGPFILDLFSVCYLEDHILVGPIELSPFLCHLVPLRFRGFQNSEPLCTAVRKDLEAGAPRKVCSHWSGVAVTRMFLHCLRGQIPFLGRALVVPFIRASVARCITLQLWSVKPQKLRVLFASSTFRSRSSLMSVILVECMLSPSKWVSCAYNCTTSNSH